MTETGRKTEKKNSRKKQTHSYYSPLMPTVLTEFTIKMLQAMLGGERVREDDGGEEMRFFPCRDWVVSV